MEAGNERYKINGSQWKMKYEKRNEKRKKYEAKCNKLLPAICKKAFYGSISTYDIYKCSGAAVAQRTFILLFFFLARHFSECHCISSRFAEILFNKSYAHRTPHTTHIFFPLVSFPRAIDMHRFLPCSLLFQF